MAGKLQVGEPVRLLDGGTATVVALRTLPGVGPMWDLSLSAVHTFAVGDAQVVVHNCGGKIEYGNTDLSQAVKDQRITARDVGHNYAAARLDNGSIITAVSDANGHAEQYLLEGAQSRGNSIVELYSERQPCAASCAGRLSEASITNVSWSWDWNGVDHASVSSEMRSFFRAMMP